MEPVMFKLCQIPRLSINTQASELYDESTFYDTFLRDLRQCQHEVIIESPFVTTRRLATLLPTLKKLKDQHTRVIINTRDPEEHESEYMRLQAHSAISQLQHIGIHVLYTVGHHRKLAIIDRSILFEGSLNILSQNDSCEVMRRVESTELAWQMARFIKVDSFIQ